MKLFLHISLLLTVAVCFAQTDWKLFGDYWYDGTAEITTYQLQQSRYGEMRDGTAVMIFVTEPFHPVKHVKMDKPGNDAVTVMKLNMTKKFNTGIYPYSMMLSSFVPVSTDKYPRPLKVTGSIQEWCGHTFTQINLTGASFLYKGFSYFESESDHYATIKVDWLEDALWQRLRFDPLLAPTGNFTLLPGIFYERFAHQKPAAVKANASRTIVSRSDFGEKEQYMYRLTHDDRTLTIYLEKSFPHIILGWTEQMGNQTTTAKQITNVKNKYWQMNKNEFVTERAKLGLKD